MLDFQEFILEKCKRVILAAAHPKPEKSKRVLQLEGDFGRESQVPRKTPRGGSQEPQWKNQFGALRAAPSPSGKARQAQEPVGAESKVEQRVGRTRACQAVGRGEERWVQQQPLSSTGQSFSSFGWTGLLAPALPSWGPGIPSGPLWAKEGTGTAKKPQKSQVTSRGAAEAGEASQLISKA